MDSQVTLNALSIVTRFVTDQQLAITLRRNRELAARLRESESRMCAMASDRYLLMTLELIDLHKSWGYGGVDIIDGVLTSDWAVDDRTEFLEQLTYQDKCRIIPTLTSLGYRVFQFPEVEDTALAVHWKDSDATGLLNPVSEQEARNYASRAITVHDPPNH